MPEPATADAAVDLNTGAGGDAGVAADRGAGGDDTPVAGASAVVEAATAEAAISEVHERFGPGATIVEARRVLRGGIGGFFAKEHVQLHVAAGPTGRDGDDAPERDVRRDPDAQADIAARAVALAAELTQGSPQGAAQAGSPGAPRGAAQGSSQEPRREADSPVDRLLGATHAGQHRDDPVDDETLDFGTFLRSQLARQDAGTSGTAEVADGTAEVADGTAEVADGTAAAASTPEREVQPMRWPGSHEPWSVYGVRVTPGHDADVEVVPAGPAQDDPPAVEDTIPAADAATDPAAAAATDPAAAAATDPAAAAATDPAAAPARRPATDDLDAAAPTTVAASNPPTTAPTEGPAWSVTRLLHLGLPASLVHDLDVADPGDDLSWVAALTDALRPVCRPLPTGPAVLVGPDAPRIAEVVDLPVARSRTWLDALGANRWRHLVIGGQGWREELTDEPLAVSWVRTEDLPDALRCATELGLVLGYGPQGGQLRRARPLDVALAVRELVEMR